MSANVAGSGVACTREALPATRPSVVPSPCSTIVSVCGRWPPATETSRFVRQLGNAFDVVCVAGHACKNSENPNPLAGVVGHHAARLLEVVHTKASGMLLIADRPLEVVVPAHCGIPHRYVAVPCIRLEHGDRGEVTLDGSN